MSQFLCALHYISCFAQHYMPLYRKLSKLRQGQPQPAAMFPPRTLSTRAAPASAQAEVQQDQGQLQVAQSSVRTAVAVRTVWTICFTFSIYNMNTSQKSTAVTPGKPANCYQCRKKQNQRCLIDYEYPQPLRLLLFQIKFFRAAAAAAACKCNLGQAACKCKGVSKRKYSDALTTQVIEAQVAAKKTKIKTNATIKN